MHSKYRGDADVGTDRQLKFVDQTFKPKRNRLKVGLNFQTTLPKAFCDNPNCKQAEKIEEVFSFSNAIEGHQLHQPSVPSYTFSTFQAETLSGDANNLSTSIKPL